VIADESFEAFLAAIARAPEAPVHVEHLPVELRAAKYRESLRHRSAVVDVTHAIADVSSPRSEDGSA
jgi:hypothetical protein